MSDEEGTADRISMSQKELDVLKILQPVLEGQRSQAEAARLLDLSVRQVRRILVRLREQGESALIHGLRGKPSNRQHPRQLRQEILQAYQQRYADFGPTLAAEKLAQEGWEVCPETLRRWLIEAGLWQRRRQREPHRSRRPRRDCFGELVQIDASIHDWLEGRGETVVLIAMIDDATSRVLARFYPQATVETHMELLQLWLKRYGRPLALYSDRHSIFEPQDKGRDLVDAETQFGRALRELDIALIRARSPQAKGRVERFFGTAQDRWVKEMRLQKITTAKQANGLLSRKLIARHNLAFAKNAASSSDAHRPLGPEHDLAAILSHQETRVVSNDYVVRFRNRHFQLLPPIYPGQRKGQVIVEVRLDGSVAIRFGGHYLKYKELTPQEPVGGSAPKPPEFSASAADASEAGQASGPDEEPEASGIQPTDGRSGCTPAEPYPSNGEQEDSKAGPKRPAEDHPWRKSYKTMK